MGGTVVHLGGDGASRVTSSTLQQQRRSWRSRPRRRIIRCLVGPAYHLYQCTRTLSALILINFGALPERRGLCDQAGQDVGGIDIDVAAPLKVGDNFLARKSLGL